MSHLSTSMDAADEAGGEAIFSSDGLPPLPAPRAPKFVSQFTESEEMLDSGEPMMDPGDAVRVFSKSKESPHERLARLQRELADLEKDIKSEDVAKFAAELSSRLEIGGMGPKDDLIKMMDDHLQQRDEAEKSTEGGIVYELYGGKAPPSSLLEERLLKVEQLVGGAGSSRSMMERLKDMESKMEHMDEKSIEEASTRAKVIRSDLEAASKARSKLTSTTSSADSKMISELYSQVQQLEGISGHLPALTHRLQQLAHLHVQGASFAARLGSAETSLASIQGTLKSLESSLGDLETHMAQNVKVMDANMKKLEESIV